MLCNRETKFKPEGVAPFMHDVDIGGNRTDGSVDALSDAHAGTHVKNVASGLWHSMVLTTIGDVYCFGRNDNGQIGSKSKASVSVVFNPTLVEFVEERGCVDQDVNIISIAAGGRHSLALTDNMCLYGWGANQFGQVRSHLVGDEIEAPLEFEVPALIVKLTKLDKFTHSLAHARTESKQTSVSEDGAEDTQFRSKSVHLVAGRFNSGIIVSCTKD